MTSLLERFQYLDAPGKRDIPAVAWLVLPALIFFIPLIADAVYFGYNPDASCIYDYETRAFNDPYCNFMWAEISLVELVSAALIVLGLAVSLQVCRRAAQLPYLFQRWWL